MKKKLLALLAATALLASLGAGALAADTQAPEGDVGMGGPGFLANDVTEADWFYNAVVTVLNDSIMANDDEGNFNPQQVMTRQQIAVALYNDANVRGKEALVTEGGNAFQEAPDYGQIAPDAVEAMGFCYNAKILTGDDKGNLNPGSPVSRQEMAALLQRYCAQVKIGDSAAGGMAIREFSDYDAIQEWARGSITFCLGNAILKGNADGSYGPTGSVTRAQCAQMLTNMMELASAPEAGE